MLHRLCLSLTRQLINQPAFSDANLTSELTRSSRIVDIVDIVDIVRPRRSIEMARHLQDLAVASVGMHWLTSNLVSVRLGVGGTSPSPCGPHDLCDAMWLPQHSTAYRGWSLGSAVA